MKTIDCDTHYWPIEFLDRVDHPAKGRIDWTDDKTVAFHGDGKLARKFRTSRWNLAERKAAMDEEGFDVQVLIPDNRLVIGSDLDHGDPIAIWPETVRQLRALPGLDRAQQDRILAGNAAELFGLEAMVPA